MRAFLRHILPLILLISTLTGCKKEAMKPKEVYHVSITSSHQELKFLSFGTDKQRGFSSKVYEADFQVVAGEKIQVWTGYEQVNQKPGRIITVIVTKGAKVIDNKTQTETVHIAVNPEP